METSTDLGSDRERASSMKPTDDQITTIFQWTYLFAAIFFAVLLAAISAPFFILGAFMVVAVFAFMVGLLLNVMTIDRGEGEQKLPSKIKDNVSPIFKKKPIVTSCPDDAA